jgi:hypothetical protein
MSIRLLRVVLLSVVACSGTAHVPDAPAADDAPPADASPDAPAPDALAKIACGTETCDVATQLCVVRTPVGPAQSFTCEPVPARCAADRSCACVQATVCTGGFSRCTDAADPDTVTCECPQCQ